MYEEGLTVVDKENKYPELLQLYNAWYERTAFMSVGNKTVPEWDALVEYCKKHRKEALEFFLDLIDCYEDSHKKGIRADNVTGFYLDVLDECFPDLYHCDGFVPMKDVQKFYEVFANGVLGRMKPMDGEFVEFVNDNFWDLV